MTATRTAVHAAVTTLLVLALTLMAGSTAVDAQQQPRGQVQSDGPQVALTVAALTTILGPGAREAATDEAAQAEPDGQDDVVARILIENTGDDPVDSLAVTLEVFQRITSRSALHVALDDDAPRRVTRLIEDVRLEVRDGEPLAPGAIAGVELRLTARQLGWGNPEDLRGVYPVQITVAQGSGVLDRTTTAITFLSDTFPGPFEPLLATAVTPIVDAPWRRVNGIYAPGIDAAIEPGGRLDRILLGLEADPTAAFTLVTSPHLLEDLADRANGFTESAPDGTTRTTPRDAPAARLAASFLSRLTAVIAAGPRAPAIGLYGDADTSGVAALDPGLRPDAASLVVESRRRFQELAGREAELEVHSGLGRLTDAALDVLAGTGTEVVVLPWSQQRGPDLDQVDRTPAAVRSLRTASGQRLTAIVSDPWLDAFVRDVPSAHGPLIAANRALAETAMVFMETPAVSERGIALILPPTWDASPQITAALLAGLRTAPWLQLTPALELARSSDATTPRIELATPQSPFPTADLAGRIDQTQRDLDALLAALPPGTTRFADREITAYQDDLLRAPSWWWRNTSVATGLVAGVERAVDGAFGVVTVPSASSITLTAETGTIPITLQRVSGEAIEVTVSLDAGARLSWPEGNSIRVLLAPGAARTVSFATRANTPGTIALQVVVEDPTGTHEIARSTISVRSTAISVPALGGIVVIILGLLMIGLLGRGRRARPQLEVVRNGAT